MNRRELLGACVVGLGVGGAAKVVHLKIRALDPEGFAQFALRERVRVELGLLGLPATGQITAVEERFGRIPALTEIRYRVHLDGPGHRLVWFTSNRLEHTT